MRSDEYGEVRRFLSRHKAMNRKKTSSLFLGQGAIWFCFNPKMDLAGNTVAEEIGARLEGSVDINSLGRSILRAFVQEGPRIVSLSGFTAISLG